MLTQDQVTSEIRDVLARKGYVTDITPIEDDLIGSCMKKDYQARAIARILMAHRNAEATS